VLALRPEVAGVPTTAGRLARLSGRIVTPVTLLAWDGRLLRCRSMMGAGPATPSASERASGWRQLLTCVPSGIAVCRANFGAGDGHCEREYCEHHLRVLGDGRGPGHCVEPWQSHGKRDPRSSQPPPSPRPLLALEAGSGARPPGSDPAWPVSASSRWCRFSPGSAGFDTLAGPESGRTRLR
jgi:hypothetical protein